MKDKGTVRNILKREVNRMEITGTMFAMTVGDFISGVVTPIANAIIKLAAPTFSQ